MKTIKKVSVTPIEEKTGHIYDTTNIDNKAENTYSAEIIDTHFQEKLNVNSYFATNNNEAVAEASTLKVEQYGKLVILTFKDVRFKQELHNDAFTILFSNIPRVVSSFDENGNELAVPPYTILQNFNTNSGARIGIKNNYVMSWYANVNTTDLFCGQFMYITD